jgi:xanthine dehydrogenase accessory factor
MRREIFEQLQADRAAKRPVVLVTFLQSGEQRLLYRFGKQNTRDLPHEIAEAARSAIAADRPAQIDTADGPVFLNVFNPPLRLAIVGAVHIAQALAPMASLAGYEVHVVDPRGAFASAERFPNVSLSTAWPDEALAAFAPDARAAIVTLTHDPKLDDPALACALRSDAFYVGSLGSRKTHARRLERLAALGIQPHDLERIRGPVGLAIGAQTPAEIAIAILAEMTQTLRAGTK